MMLFTATERETIASALTLLADKIERSGGDPKQCFMLLDRLQEQWRVDDFHNHA